MRGGMREVGVVGFGNRGDIESMASNAQDRTLVMLLCTPASIFLPRQSSCEQLMVRSAVELDIVGCIIPIELRKFAPNRDLHYRGPLFRREDRSVRQASCSFR